MAANAALGRESGSLVSTMARVLKESLTLGESSWMGI